MSRSLTPVPSLLPARVHLVNDHYRFRLNGHYTVIHWLYNQSEHHHQWGYFTSTDSVQFLSPEHLLRPDPSHALAVPRDVYPRSRTVTPGISRVGTPLSFI